MLHYLFEELCTVQDANNACDFVISNIERQNAIANTDKTMYGNQ